MRVRFVVALFVLMAGCSKPEPPKPVGPPPPPPATLEGVVSELNEICADTWCEGGYRFRFTKLECATALECRLSFDATKEGAAHAASATIGLSGFDEIATPEGASTVSFQTVVNDAIAEWETKSGAQ